ncbi:sensitive to high expression protein 9, mitochondrial [Monosporozyma servazzii]
MSLLHRPANVLLFKRVTQHLLRTQSVSGIKLFHQTQLNYIDNDTPTNFHQRVHTLKQASSQYMNQFNRHFAKMKDSLREANKKIAEQEREAQDKKLNYNQDRSSNKRIEGLPSEIELKRKQWSRKLGFYMDSLQETLFTATRALNDVTGYSSIQQLRNSIASMEKELDSVKERVKQHKDLYTDAINQRIQSQREVNDLLQRKNSWSSNDLERFTQLYKDDTMNSKRVEECKLKLNEIETREDQLNNDLYRAILTRYHEEQIWSDKIRRTSTWGTFILLGINICLFLILQLLLEPWKRRRLTRSFEDKVKSALEQFSKEQEEKGGLIPTQHVKLTPSDSQASKDVVVNKPQEISDKVTKPSRVIPKGWKGFFIKIRYTVSDFWFNLVHRCKQLIKYPSKFTKEDVLTYFLISQVLDRAITLVLLSG